MKPHDLSQRLHAVHAWHLQVQRDHMRMQFLNLLQSELAIHCCTNHFDGRILFQHLRNKFSHQCGIVNDKYFCRAAHAVAPAPLAVVCDRARPSFETTACTSRINTTVPSPRIEAPLTRSVDTRWSSRALMTSSSSPTSLSTINPNLRSPSAITITNILLFASAP